MHRTGICLEMCACSACSRVQLFLTTRLPCPWDNPSKNPGVGCYFLLLGIFLTQGSSLCLLHLDSLPLHHLEAPRDV